MAVDDILSKGAILQNDGESFAIMTRLLGGLLDMSDAKHIAEVAERYGVEKLKVTGDQRLALFGIKELDLDQAYEDLGLNPMPGTALCQQYLKVCPGNAHCVRGQRDTLGLAKEIQERYLPFPKITAKVKIGVAGCFNSCAEPAIKDIGLIGLPKGWTLMVGGAGGKEPMLGEVLCQGLDDIEAVETVGKILTYYRGVSFRPASRNLRLGVILKKVGKDQLRSVCGLA